ncbi:cyclin-J [Anopheles nili]|uniref:cyclin-J n=1 Tax=Anopheles nili TaxID=185578 RepID=UPI00237AFAB9|nr:cyclin-J [Anopheles nili]
MDRWNTYGNAVYCNEYNEDILDTLKECETKRQTVSFTSPQLNHRQSLVDLIRAFCEQKSFHRETVHLAIYLLDVFMSNHDIADSQLKLVAFTCLYLACKIEENEPHIPTTNTISKFLGNAYIPADFNAMEVMILIFFDWHLTIPTVATFLNIFSMHVFDEDDYINQSQPRSKDRMTSLRRTAQCLYETCIKIVDSTLNKLELCNVTPSLLAAGCFATARCLTWNVKAWTNRLAYETGYEYEEVHEVYKKLLFDVIPEFQSNNGILKRSITDSGYLSSAETCSTISIDTVSDYESENSSRSACGESMTSSENSNMNSGERNTKKRKISTTE